MKKLQFNGSIHFLQTSFHRVLSSLIVGVGWVTQPRFTTMFVYNPNENNVKLLIIKKTIWAKLKKYYNNLLLHVLRSYCR